MANFFKLVKNVKIWKIYKRTDQTRTVDKTWSEKLVRAFNSSGFKSWYLWWLKYTYNIKICKIHKISLGEHVYHHHHWMYKVGRIRHPGQGHQSTPRQDWIYDTFNKLNWNVVLIICHNWILTKLSTIRERKTLHSFILFCYLHVWLYYIAIYIVWFLN